MSEKAFIVDALSKMKERKGDIASSLEEFQRSSHVLSDDHPRLIDEYPDQWVAVAEGAVVAHGETLEHVLARVDSKKISRADVIVRFIERTNRTLIL